MSTFNKKEASLTKVKLAQTWPAPSSARTVTIPGLEHGLIEVDDDVRLHYVVAGEGEPVVLVPGWPFSWYVWRSVIPMLAAQGRRVYAIDPRGLGDSDRPRDGYDLDRGAQDLHNFIERLDISANGPVDIVGHDIGTWIVHALAANYPNDIRRLVVMDSHIPGVSPLPPAGYPDDFLNARSWHFAFNRLQDLPELLISGHERQFLQWFVSGFKTTRTWTIDPDAFEEYYRTFSAPGAVRAGMEYYRAAFSAQGMAAAGKRAEQRLEMPILTIGGGDADGENLHQTMTQFSSDVRTVIFEGVGHHLPEECPAEVARAILNFWAE